MHLAERAEATAPIVKTVGPAIANAAQYVGGTTALVFGLTADEWSVVGIIGGLLLGVLGFVVNWIYRARHYELAQRRAHLGEDDE